MNDDSWALEKFEGTARLFPLPNLVLFPHVVQPLHVFEPRYRQMAADALATDGLIAMALLREDRESTEAKPLIYPVACLGRIVADKMLDDGRYLLLLRGLSRVRVGEELASDSLYRVARVELMPDRMTLPAAEVRQLRRKLADLILPRFSGPAGDRKQLRDLFEGEMPLGALCDCLSYQLPLALPCKQQLLEETSVAARAAALVEALQSVLETAPESDPNAPRKFPPDFSLN